MLRQIMSLVKSHTFSALLCGVFGFGMMWWILDKPILEIIFSVFAALLYFSAIYSRARDCASRDRKPYSEASPYLLKGAVLSLGIVILNLILWLCYEMAWKYLTIDGSLATYSGVFYNVIYIFNTFMYTGFINLDKGSMAWYGHIIIYAVPIAAASAGYIAGLHDFLLTEKLTPFIYEKRKKTGGK